ncbi:MAG: hypothetical protein KDI66_11500, partial [Xanthomonadales bacterium]|nr:hypothetical protein [Xanthomonadales bacterium]
MRTVGFLLLWALALDVFAQYSSQQLVAHLPAAPRPMLGRSHALLNGPGSSEYRMVSASGTLHLARGHWGEGPETALPESSFAVSAG